MHSYYGYIFNNLYPLFQHMKFSCVSPGCHFCLFSGIGPGFPLHLYLWPRADHFKIYLYRVCLSTFSVLLKLLAVQNYFKTVWWLMCLWTFQNIQTQPVYLHGGWFNSGSCFHWGYVTLYYFLILWWVESPP